VRSKAEHKDHVSLAFVFDRTEDGRSLKILAVVYEHTQECLGLQVRRWIKAEKVLAALASSGHAVVPRHIRSDNGPEFIALVSFGAGSRGPR